MQMSRRPFGLFFLSGQLVLHLLYSRAVLRPKRGQVCTLLFELSMMLAF